MQSLPNPVRFHAKINLTNNSRRIVSQLDNLCFRLCLDNGTQMKNQIGAFAMPRWLLSTVIPKNVSSIASATRVKSPEVKAFIQTQLSECKECELKVTALPSALLVRTSVSRKGHTSPAHDKRKRKMVRSICLGFLESPASARQNEARRRLERDLDLSG